MEWLQIFVWFEDLRVVESFETLEVAEDEVGPSGTRVTRGLDLERELLGR